MYVGHEKVGLNAFSDHFIEEFQKEKQRFDHCDFLDFFDGNVKSAPWGLISGYIFMHSFSRQFWFGLSSKGKR